MESQDIRIQSLDVSPGSGADSRLKAPPRVRTMTDITNSFLELTERLKQQYEIDKGVLIVRQEHPPELAAVSMWSNGLGHDGLKVNLPTESSLFEAVARGGEVYTESFCGVFSGNFFERKLLLDEDSHSFVLVPLKAGERVVGLLGYSSRKATSFTLFEEGVLDKVAEELGAAIAAGMPAV